MHISEITIHNIRSIRSLEMVFPKGKEAGWHVIIGDNGSGKSSIIRSLALALIGPENAIALRQNWHNWLSHNEDHGKIGLQILRDVEWDGGGTAASRHDPEIPISNELYFQSINNTPGVKGIPKGKKFHPSYFNWANHHSGWYSSAFGPFRRFSGGSSDLNTLFYSNPKVGAHLSVFGEDVALGEALKWLEDLDYKRLMERESKGVGKSQRTFEAVREFINQSKLLPHNTEFEKMTTDGPLFRDGNGHQVHVIEMSDGYRSILSMTFEILRQLIDKFGVAKIFPESITEQVHIDVPGVILIDEVDIHLHPSWQTKIGEWFTRIFPCMQFIVTTHSPLICRAAGNGTIWRVSKPGAVNDNISQLTGAEKDKLLFGNILDAYGSDVFGREVVHTEKMDKKIRLGYLNVQHAMGKLAEKEQKERLVLQAILGTDVVGGLQES